MSTSIHINWTNYSDVRKKRRICPSCKLRRMFVACYQEWYGWTNTCLGCGDRWTDGEMHERPFAPRWRKDNIASAKKVWDGWLTLIHWGDVSEGDLL